MEQKKKSDFGVNKYLQIDDVIEEEMPVYRHRNIDIRCNALVDGHQIPEEINQNDPNCSLEFEEEKKGPVEKEIQRRASDELKFMPR